jgi:hypothetical protein
VTEPPDDLLEPESNPSPSEVEDQPDDDDEPRWSGEESLGLLPPD